MLEVAVRLNDVEVVGLPDLVLTLLLASQLDIAGGKFPVGREGPVAIAEEELPLPTGALLGELEAPLLELETKGDPG